MAKKKNLLVDCFTKKVKVIKQDLRDEYSVDVVAASIMECLQSKVGPALFDMLNSVLLGFCDDMQQEMAENLLDFVNDNILHRTGCYSVDVTLAQCYMWIGMEQGIVKEKVVEEWLNAYKY